ncbi:MAG: hypothetical protein ABL973_07155 [Micropepsaceae bacterium]
MHMAKLAPDYTPSISDDAVEAKTGRRWKAWFTELDRNDAAKLDHAAIARLLVQKFGAPRWWNQMIAVEYERARGLRIVNQQPSGFTLNASKTLTVSLGTLYRTLAKPDVRSRWFPKGDLEITSTTSSKYFRAVWNGGPTRLEINVYAKGPKKSQITVQHSKFPTARAMEIMRTRWKSALQELTTILNEIKR